LVITAWILYVVAAILAVIGLVTVYQDSSPANAIVYIIYAGRGTVWVGAGVIAAVIGTGLYVVGALARLRGELTNLNRPRAV
jgi:cell division protein FtsW (lipid II flippase)